MGKKDKNILQDGEIRSLCKFKKHIEENFETLGNLVCKPTFICMKCGRVANDERFLCRPKELTTQQKK